MNRISISIFLYLDMDILWKTALVLVLRFAVKRLVLLKKKKTNKFSLSEVEL